MPDLPPPISALQPFHYGHLKEEVRIRIWQRVRQAPAGAAGEGLTVAKPVIHVATYNLAPACLNDVGAYYCARNDRDACLSGFTGRMALWTHLTRPTENKAEHVLCWLCKVHGPEVMFPGDGEEPLVFDGGPTGLSNQAMFEHFQRMTEYRENGGIKQAPTPDWMRR